MFSGPSDVSMVDLLDSCSSIEPSPPVWTPSPKPVQSSTPNSVSTSNIEPSLPLHTPSPKLIHSNTSNSTEPSQPLAHSTTLKTTTNSCSKRKALFPQEEPEGSFPTVAKTRLPDHLPFPDRFSIRASSETQGQIVGARESLNRRENMAQGKSKERWEEPLGTMSYQTSSKRSPPLSAPVSPRMVDSALDLSNIWRLVVSPDALHWATGDSWELLFILLELTYISSTQTFRKQTTFRDATNGFPAKWRLRKERRNSILMTRYLGSASDWLRQISQSGTINQK